MKNSLTKKQKDAVESMAASTMVIAGPGTGKTHILASRIEYLTKEQKIDPENILALTFTESGARSMQERVVSFLGTAGYKVAIHTFHSFASSLINDHPEIFGYRRDLKSITEIDRAKLIRGLISGLDKEKKLKHLRTADDKYFYYKDISSALSTLKKEGYTPDEFKKLADDWEKEFNDMPDEEKLSSRGPRKGKVKREVQDLEKRIKKNKELALIYKSYQEALKEKNYYDYEDMIIRAAHGLENSDELRYEIHSQYHAILVDEYQDTSGAQNKLLFPLINNEAPNIFIVGDDDQAIYRFQGATIQNFSDFLARFPDTNIVSLEDNFRSPQFLLNAALDIANQNTERITAELSLPDKTLTAHGPFKDSEDTEVHTFETDAEEHAFLIDEILKLRDKGTEWKDIAVITRKNNEQESLAELLRAHDIPTAISAQQNALTNPAVSSLLAMARACMRPHEDDNMLMFLLHPATPILAEDVWSMLANRGRQDSIYTALNNALSSESEDNAKQARGGLKDAEKAQKAFGIINELSELQTIKTGAHWLQNVIEKTGFLEWLLRQHDAPYLIANVRAITDEAKRIQEGNPQYSIAETLEHFRTHLELEIPLKPSLAHFAFENTVRIMTAHNVKGQEFQNVFIIHAVDRHWSNSRGGRKGITMPEAIPAQTHNENDERRIFYVALTRAKEKIFITYSKVYSRGITGTEEREREMLPASFVEELKKTVPEKITKKDTTKIMSAPLRAIPEHSANDLQKEIVKNIVESPAFALSPTAFNSFLECPQKFLYEQLLRVPKVKTFSLAYGEAIHLALQKYFETPEEKRGIKGLLGVIRSYIDMHSTLDEADNNLLHERAEETLSEYYEETLKNEPQPLYVEYAFPRGKVAWNSVRISGKVDKIYAIDDENAGIVDYKTSKKAPSLNQIMGETQSPKDDLLRQLMFYRLLAENYPMFNYTAKEFVLDFVEPNKQITVKFTDEQFENFKQLLKEAWESIQDLSFLGDTKKFPPCGECRYCAISF